MQEIVFATNNINKLSEIRRICGDEFRILGLADIGCTEDIPETADTFEGNAELKARYVKEHYGFDCFADDSGLMVDALGGEPGVYSARYAGGEGHDSEANMNLLLKKLEGVTDRRARFVTVIALIIGNELHTFSGTVEGEILTERHGNGGFGYDPVFRPLEADCTFAEMASDDKNAISHRGRATAALIDFLKK
jgi:non-canonical purine NTP pyrophosphatase, rdgB/HAM1 family